MKILAGCIVKVTEFFFHPGYTSALSYHISSRPPPRPRVVGPPRPEGSADVFLGSEASVGEGMTGVLLTDSEAAIAPASDQGFYVDMFTGADRWTTLIIGVVLFFITAALITVMRGRRVSIDGAEPAPAEILEPQTAEGG